MNLSILAMVFTIISPSEDLAAHLPKGLSETFQKAAVTSRGNTFRNLGSGARCSFPSPRIYEVSASSLVPLAV